MEDCCHRIVNYLRVSLTDFCNYRCSYCMPPFGVKAKPREDILTLEEVYFIIRLFAQLGITKVRLTGGEPLLRPGVEGLIRSLNSLEPINDIAMTTNASLLAGRAKDLKKAGLKRVNISLDSLDEDVFRNLTRGGELAPVLAGVKDALEAGLGVKINVVLLKGINDKEIKDFIELTVDRPIDVRFIEAMPLGPTGDFCREHFLSNGAVLETVSLEAIERDHASTARLYRYGNAMGRVGLISPLSCNFCSECNRLRLTADGLIKPCLHSDDTIEIRQALRRGEDLMPYLRRAFEMKPAQHHLDQGVGTADSMNLIGG